MVLLELLERLAEAQQAIDEHDAEFRAPPHGDYERVAADLVKLTPAERAELVSALSDEHSGIRTEAAKAAGVLRIGAARPALEHGLADEHRSVRDACGQALVRLVPREALRLVCERGVSNHTLGAAADAAVDTPDVLDWLRHVDPWSQGRDAWTKVYARDQAKVAPIFEEKVLEESLDWVLGVAQIVVENGGSWARRPFAQLTRSKDMRIRRAASEVLTAIGGDDDETESLLGVLAATNAFGARAAVEAVFAEGRRRRRPVVARAIAVCRYPEALLEELVKLEEEEPERAAIIEALPRWLAHDDESVVVLAIQTATALRAEEIAPAVGLSLRHPQGYEGISDACTDYMKALGANAVRELARDGSSIAILVLGRLGLAALPYVEVIIHALRKGDVATRANAAISLGELGMGNDALLEAVRFAPPAVGFRAVQALVKLRDARVVPLAIRALATSIGKASVADDWCMRASCIAALGELGGPEAAAELEQSLASPDPRVRRDARAAFAKLRGG